MNLLNWLTAPRNELLCFKLVGRRFLLIPWAFALIGEMSVLVYLNSSLSMLCCAIMHFSAFSYKFASSKTFKTSLTLFHVPTWFLLSHLKYHLYIHKYTIYICESEVHQFLEIRRHYSKTVKSSCESISTC